MYGSVESLDFTPETVISLHVNYTVIKISKIRIKNKNYSFKKRDRVVKLG